jgi:predicted transcriptional regulator
MTNVVIKSYEEFKAMTLAAARNEGAAMEANVHYFENVEALVRLLTPDNRALLRTIRDEKPKSVADLARMTGRAEPNLFRTIEKLIAIGLVELLDENRRKVPVAKALKFQIEIDPFENNDQLVRI